MLLALSEPVQLALTASIVPTVTLIVGLITLWLKQRSDALALALKTAADNKVIADDAAAKLTSIEAKVDGTASKALERNEAQARELKEFMLSVLAEKEERARILAKAAAEKLAGGIDRAGVPEPPLTPPSTPAASAHLQHIDAQTAETAINTRETERMVDDLAKGGR